MEEKKLAFESEEISIGFRIISDALGDNVKAKCVFEALIKLAPKCKIDIFYSKESGKNYVRAFFRDSENLNLLINTESYADMCKKYDLALNVWHIVRFDYVNVNKLKTVAPDLFTAVQKMTDYSKKYPYKANNNVATILTNIVRSHILNTNHYTCFSCNGALPICDDHVHIPLTPEGERGFQELKLSKNYITIGSNLSRKGLKRHAVKEWPIFHMLEYVSLINQHYPQIEVVQIGGGDVVELENADRHILDADLEIVKYVLKNSLLHVDCESGVVHLATQLGTKCIVLFGPTDEKYFGFKQNFNIVSNFCHPCYHAWDNGSQCLLGAKEPPCMASITPQQVFEVTRNYISHLELKNNT